MMLAAQDGWVYGVFTQLRAQAIGGASQSVNLAFGLGCLIFAYKMIRIAYDLMSDEQAGGHGSIRMSQLLVPLMILFAIKAASPILGAFDGVVNGVTTGISHSYSSTSVSLMYSKAADAVEKATAEKLGEDIVAEAKAISDRSTISAEDISEIAATETQGANIIASLILNRSKKKRDLDNLSQAAAERIKQKAEDKVDETKDDDAKTEGILSNVKAIRSALDSFLKLRKESEDISDGSWRAAIGKGTFIPSVAVIVYNALFYVIECFAELTLCLLAMFFPWTLVISLVGAWSRAYMEWAGRYIVVSFWKVVAVGINYVVQMAMGATLKYNAMRALSDINGGASDVAVGKVAAGVTVSAIIAVAGIFALLHVNDIAQAIIPAGGGGGMGSMGNAAGGFAGSVANTPGKAATGIQGVVANQKGIASASAQKAFQNNVTNALGKLTE